MSLYLKWGFSSSPFSIKPLPASDLGRKLLVGRSMELDRLQMRFLTPAVATTVEGANGVGKTSLINVAAYTCFNRYFSGEESQLLIPCREHFRLSSSQDARAFELEVYMAVAQTLIETGKMLQTTRAHPNTRALDRWLNSPQYQEIQGGIQTLVGGINAGYNPQPNAGEGFLRSGFPRLVNEFLARIFPHDDSGGVICLIDNLEMLETTHNAHRLLDQIRDTLLASHGLRWVLCGALGIVRSVAASPRLKGFMAAPVEVTGIAESRAAEIFNARITTFATDPYTYYMPLNPHNFEHLYGVYNDNARFALSGAHEFCLAMSEAEAEPTDVLNKEVAYFEWLHREANQTYDAVRSKLGVHAWDILRRAVGMGGSFSPSDHGAFGFKSFETMRPHTAELQVMQMVQMGLDETDSRRKILTVTPQGWLVDFARKRRE